MVNVLILREFEILKNFWYNIYIGYERDLNIVYTVRFKAGLAIGVGEIVTGGVRNIFIVVFLKILWYNIYTKNEKEINKNERTTYQT